MTIEIFREEEANAIFVSHGTIGAYPFNCLRALGTGTGNVSIQNVAKKYPDDSDFFEIFQSGFIEFVDSSGATYGSTETEVVNNLNSIFEADGAATGSIPTITSSLAINVNAGDPVNYYLTADFGVGYEWAGLTTGLAVASFNERNLIGTVPAGTHNITMTAANYNGSTSATLVITATTTYTNTLSTRFNNNDYLDASATTSNPLYRASNGAGAGDAWTVAFWFKPGTHTGGAKQTIMMFGGTANSDERVHVHYKGNDKKITLRYGSDTNKLELATPNSSLTIGTWHHVMITYDGGTTDSNEYNRFEIWIDGSSQTTSDTSSGSGFAGEMTDGYFRIGKNGSKNDYLKDSCFVEEIALWEGDETANVATIYNGGSTHDLSLLGSAPDHYWRMGDDDTFPTILDNAASLNFTMLNMTASDFVSDVP